jgi:hypothetical protein
MQIHEESMLDAILAMTVPSDLTADERAFTAELNTYRRDDALTVRQADKLRRIYNQTVGSIKTQEMQK